MVWWGSGGWLQDAFAGGDSYGVGAVVDTEFVEDIGDVIPDRAFGDGEFSRDLFVGEAIGHEAYHFDLSRAEGVRGGRRRALGDGFGGTVRRVLQQVEREGDGFAREQTLPGGPAAFEGGGAAGGTHNADLVVTVGGFVGRQRHVG